MWQGRTTDGANRWVVSHHKPYIDIVMSFQCPYTDIHIFSYPQVASGLPKYNRRRHTHYEVLLTEHERLEIASTLSLLPACVQTQPATLVLGSHLFERAEVFVCACRVGGLKRSTTFTDKRSDHGPGHSLSSSSTCSLSSAPECTAVAATVHRFIRVELKPCEETFLPANAGRFHEIAYSDVYRRYVGHKYRSFGFTQIDTRQTDRRYVLCSRLGRLLTVRRSPRATDPKYLSWLIETPTRSAGGALGEFDED